MALNKTLLAVLACVLVTAPVEGQQPEPAMSVEPLPLVSADGMVFAVPLTLPVSNGVARPYGLCIDPEGLGALSEPLETSQRERNGLFVELYGSQAYGLHIDPYGFGTSTDRCEVGL